MLDMTTVIAPKSDQLNADDLITGPRTIKITKVTGADSKEQPISIFFEGDNGKPYKPCLSMRRALVHVWGKNGLDYVGRSMTLYNDPEVIFGGVKTGGIRISHMSHMEGKKTFALAANKVSRKPYTVLPLVVENLPSADDMIKSVEQAATLDELKIIFSSAQRLFKDSKDFARIHEAKEKRKKELTEQQGVTQ